MEVGVLTFTPEEYQILEDIEFDETIERPEAVRFYTLDEQTTDAYEKLMPRGRTTRFQRDKVRRDVDRLQELYETYVSALPETYALREPEVSVGYDWVFPVSTSAAEARKYDWNSSWRPVFENLRQPNFIPTLIAALPRPYGGGGEEGVPLYEMRVPTEIVVNKEGDNFRRGLPEYVIPRTQYHEDKTISIVLDPVKGSEDKIGFEGYFLRKRPLDIPNPLAEHPFLKANEDTFVPSTAPLKDVVPTLDAVLTHAVPVTKDPYGEAMPYLKLWDVRLSSIPWSAWKSKFPPVDPVNAHEAPAPIEFPKPGQLSVPEKIQDIYSVKYEPGMSVRLWLMKRLDGGGLVMDLLRSSAIENGSVNIVPGVDLPKAAYPDSTPEACSLEGKPFAEFMTSGVLRRIFVEKDKDPYAITKYQCVPLEFVKQERARLGYAGRLPWKETTGDDIKKAYLKRLTEVTPPAEAVAKEAAAPKTPAKAESVRHAEVRAILGDEQRYAEDKLRDIREILTETTLSNNRYTDQDGALVVCSHTLALLSGDLAADRQKYYDTWTARVDGFRVCKFCGEQINADVYAEANEYDEDGFLIRNSEALEGPGHATAGIVDYVSGLRKLQPLFMLQTPHDDTVFLVLSLLQVLPTADVLEQFLGLGRQVAVVQFNKGTPDQIARFQGMTGLATAALILQCHIPSLVPRRSFGPRPLVLSGYPRDAPAPTTEFTIVDTLISVLRKTFEAFPSTFGGPSKALLKGVLNKPGEVKNTVTALLSAKSPLLNRKRADGKMEPTFVTELLVKAKAYVAEKPPVEQPKTLIPVVAPPKEFDVIRSYPACPSARPIWTSGRLPRVTQPDVPLRVGIQSAAGAEPVPPTVSERVVPVRIEKAEIRERLANRGRLPTSIKVGDEYRTSLMLASRLADIFQEPTPVRSVDPTQNAAELRDIAKGYALELLTDIDTAVERQTKLEEVRSKDVALYVLQADYKEERSQANKLRASQRIKIVDDLKKKSDTERELIQQLLTIGAAPYLVTRQEQFMFAREAELLQDQIRAEEDEFGEEEEDADSEAGVGRARDGDEDRDEDERGNDHGDYGDHAGLPVGRDPLEAGLWDDPARSI
jgi:hypothetical protein